MTNLFIWVAAIVILAAIVLAIFAWFYERATNEVSLIRTGVGGRKVILEGGTFSNEHQPWQRFDDQQALIR